MKEISSTLTDLLTDETFLEHVFNKSPLPSGHWTQNQSPKSPVIDELILAAKNIINYTNEDRYTLTDNEINLLKIKILTSLNK